ncbi:Kinesin-related 6 [Gossypium arboreum]|uniref:Kinesin-related 6 n=2 Tax=Gossypium arboreum TaxID=29729 RepID=A0A0B0Q0X7_GOSAR|nr:Kinesin-related 6 [Gossypium arboreum]
MEPTTPPFSSLPSSQRKNGEESPSDFSPGPIDLHSFVTELLPEVRKRPLNKKVLARNKEDIMETISNSLVVHETKLKVELTEYLEQHEFVFDAVLKEEVSNDELSQAYFLSVYRETVEPIVPMIFQCTKATSFAHDQTGSGKTYTMKPLPLKASRDILRLMHHTYRNQGFQLFVCFFGIYGGKLFDLLSDRKKDVPQEVLVPLVQMRNLPVLMPYLSLLSRDLLMVLNQSLPVLCKSSFIDLAGGGRGADATDNDKQTSLLALKECIRALDNDQGHIPFRGTTSGVKSLSEGRNPKKDLLSSTLNLKELIAQPLSSVLPTASTFEDDINGTWADQNERDDFDASEDPFEKEKMTWKKNVKPDQYSSSVSEDKNPLRSDFKHSKSDDDLNTLLQEEEDLVNAHRKQVETMNIVNEEVNLLVEADRPGKQQDGYISRLNAIFSQKADDVVQLQTQFANFEKLYRSITF